MAISHFLFLVIFISIGVTAQNSDITNLKMINEKNLPALPKIQSDSATIKGRQLRAKQFTEYVRWHSTNVLPLAEEAEKKGFQATQEEIDLQHKAISSLFPGYKIPTESVCNEIIARKYSKTIPGTFVSSDDIENAYLQQKSSFSNEQFPSLEELQPIIEMKALMEKGSIQTEVGKIKERKSIEINEKYLKENESWPVSELFINDSGDNCLASHIDNDSCLLDVQKFNSYIRYMQIPKKLSIDSARIKAIKEILSDLYMANFAREQKDDNIEILENEKQRWLKERMSKMRCKNIGRPVKDSIALHNTYSKYYDALFSKRSFLYYSVIGSSDSLYVDSIWQNLKCDTSKSDLNRLGRLKATGNSYDSLWSCSNANSLPYEFNKYADSMNIKDVKGIIKMPYGFFIIRFDSMLVQPEMKFDVVQDDLIYLATRQKWKNLDSMLDVEAYHIYISNKKLNLRPDTLNVIAFFTPANERSFNSSEIKNVIESTQSKDPKARNRGILLPSTQLPIDIRDSLLNHYNATKDKKRILGPILSCYGNWYFKVLDISKGSGRLPFSLSKKMLIDSLLAHELKSSSDSLWLKQDSALDDIALAKCYTPVFYGFSSMKKKSLNNSPDKKSNFNQIPENREENPALNRTKMIHNRVKNYDTWISRIVIKYKL